MKLHRLKDYQPGFGDFICRSSAIGPLIVTMISLGIIAAVVYWRFPPEAWWRWIIGAFMALFAWICFGIYRQSRGPQNWLLAYDGSNVTIKFRSFMNSHFPDDAVVVVTLEHREIAWFRRTRESVLTRGNKGRQRQTFSYLDIGLQNVDSAPLAAALKAERTEEPPGTWSKTRVNDFPVRLVEGDRVLRIAWGSESARVKPALKKTIAQLSSLAPVREQESTQTDLSTPGKDQPEQESRILELIERGEPIAAVTLARDTYKISLTEAKKFVDELQAK